MIVPYPLPAWDPAPSTHESVVVELSQDVEPAGAGSQADKDEE
jgi:hypothetical protein